MRNSLKQARRVQCRHEARKPERTAVVQRNEPALSTLLGHSLCSRADVQRMKPGGRRASTQVRCLRCAYAARARSALHALAWLANAFHGHGGLDRRRLGLLSWRFRHGIGCGLQIFGDPDNRSDGCSCRWADDRNGNRRGSTDCGTRRSILDHVSCFANFLASVPASSATFDVILLALAVAIFASSSSTLPSLFRSLTSTAASPIFFPADLVAVAIR